MKKKKLIEEQTEELQEVEAQQNIEEEKEEKVEKPSKSENFFKKAFNFENISLSLSIISIFFSFFTAFLPLATFTLATLQAAAAFFFLAFGCAFAALIIEVIKMIKGGYKANAQLVVVVLALVLACVVIPMTMNLNTMY